MHYNIYIGIEGDAYALRNHHLYTREALCNRYIDTYTRNTHTHTHIYIHIIDTYIMLYTYIRNAHTHNIYIHTYVCNILSTYKKYMRERQQKREKGSKREREGGRQGSYVHVHTCIWLQLKTGYSIHHLIVSPTWSISHWMPPASMGIIPIVYLHDWRICGWNVGGWM